MRAPRYVTMAATSGSARVESTRASGSTVLDRLRRWPTGSTYRSPRIVWFTHVLTVRRKLPTITLSATHMPTDTISAATTTLVRATETRRNPVARAPSMPNSRRSGRPSSVSSASVKPGASAEPAITVTNALKNPPHGRRSRTVHAEMSAALPSSTRPASVHTRSAARGTTTSAPSRMALDGRVRDASSAGTSAASTATATPSPPAIA